MQKKSIFPVLTPRVIHGGKFKDASSGDQQRPGPTPETQHWRPPTPQSGSGYSLPAAQAPRVSQAHPVRAPAPCCGSKSRERRASQRRVLLSLFWQELQHLVPCLTVTAMSSMKPPHRNSAELTESYKINYSTKTQWERRNASHGEGRGGSPVHREMDRRLLSWVLVRNSLLD